MKRVLVPALAIAMVVSSLPVSAAGPVARPSGVAPATGTIVGVAASFNGQTLSNVAVSVRNLQSGVLAASTTSNADGRFTFSRLNPGRYVVEVAGLSGPVAGSSPALTVAAGTTVAVTVNTAASPVAYGGSAAQAGGGGGGPNKALIITSIAAAAGIVAWVAIASGDDKASPSR